MGRPATSNLKAPFPGRVRIAGSFAPNNTSAVDQTTIKGDGIASVARSDVGKFTVTLSDAYSDYEHVGASLQLVSVADLVPQIGAVDVVTAKTIVINILAHATPTDIAADAASRINFEITVVQTKNL